MLTYKLKPLHLRYEPCTETISIYPLDVARSVAADDETRHRHYDRYPLETRSHPYLDVTRIPPVLSNTIDETPDREQ